MTIIDKLAWIAVADGRLLAVRSHGRTLFYLPGGKREPGESDHQALVREIREELGVELDPARLEARSVYEAPADGKGPEVRVRLTCYSGPGIGQPQPAAEIAEAAWLGLADLPRCSEALVLVLEDLVRQGLVR